MRIAIVCLAVAGALMTPSVATAQDYVPVPQQSPDGDLADALRQLGVTKGFVAKNTESLLGVDGPPTPPPANPLACATPPQLTDLQTQISNRSMSASRAASLGFPVGSITGSANSTVLIQDWTRSAVCLSNDGTTRLRWGQAVRVVASISEIDASTNVSLATIAAEATLNNRATNIEASLIGVQDTQSQVLASSLLGPLTVENFGDKAEIIESIVQKLLTSQSNQMGLIGIVQDAPELELQVAAAFAVQQIAKGRSCQSAKTRLRQGDARIAGAIEGVYVTLTGTCGNQSPGSAQRSIANDNLMGLRVND